MSLEDSPKQAPDAESIPHPWEHVEDLLNKQDSLSLTKYLLSLGVEDLRRAFSRLTTGEQEEAIALLPSEDAAKVISRLVEEQAADILEEISPQLAADIVEHLPAKVSADLLQEMDDVDSSDILEEIDDLTDAEELRQLAAYDPESAGGLMNPDPISFPYNATIKKILQTIGDQPDQYSDRDVQYLYITTDQQMLIGVLPLRNLVLSPRHALAQDVMIADPFSVTIETQLSELEEIIDQESYLALPVIDQQGVLKGLVTRSTIQEACADRQTDDYLASSGIIGGEELRSMPLLTRSFRRFTWLGPNIPLNLISASVIALHLDIIEKAVALTIFLPIVSDMSGCSGNQAVAVSIRELSLGIIRPNEFIRVAWKEGLVGIINGSVLGILLGSLANLGIFLNLFPGSYIVGGVIAAALTLNTLFSVLLGGTIPLLLKKLRIDPALASAPILTTCTDMLGFFLVLSLASVALN